jgi:DNA polymerase-3 subunit beta
MKFNALKEPFLKGINTVSKAINTKTAIPALSNILITSEKNNIKLTASDLHVTITAKIGADVESEGSITVPGKLLSSFVSQIAAEKLSCQLDGENFKVQTPKIKSSFATINADEFPGVEILHEGNLLKLKSDEFSKALQHIQFVPAISDSRPVLTGIYIKIASGKLIMAATDGFRMVEYVLNANSGDLDISCIVPAKVFVDIAKIFCAEEDQIDLYINKDKNVVGLKVNNMEAQLRMLDGDYPNYRAIIPAEFTNKAEMDKNSLGNGIKLASIFSKDYDNMIKISQTADLIEIKSQPTESGSNSSQVDGTFAGTPIDIAFNAKYMIDFVNNVSGEKIIMESNEPLKPTAFRSSDNPDFIYIVMPMRASW